ncbi:hypothetical protein CAEBREN_00939 [Caenorhabditis brenneri]|uniref:BTB domain-containing protein n=1 Tax=Caenorhabditis brenneri TaxID=135651 RepID=G0MQU5_CAEBE|nr:hypothetical protein CAEBREN_00939 [Caenorhabditis brenneri]
MANNEREHVEFEENDGVVWIGEIEEQRNHMRIFDRQENRRVALFFEHRRPQEPEPVAPREYPLGSGFPITTRFEFDRRYHRSYEAFASHNGLEWVVKFTTQEDTGILIGSATMYFNGMGDKAFMISATCTSSGDPVANGPDDIIMVDKDHCQIVFPVTIRIPAISGLQFVAPPTVITLTVHNIELVDGRVNHEQKWPKGSSWITFNDSFSVRLNGDTLKAVSIYFHRFYADLKAGSISVEETQGFYKFACLLFHNAYYGEESYQEILMLGFKYGFVNYKFQDLPDSPLDFHTRTMLPNYQFLSVETPMEHVARNDDSDGMNGSCNLFPLKLDPSHRHKRSQVEPMPKFRGGHKSQVSFYLEKTAQGTLLLAAVNMHLECPKLAKMKVALFENQHVVQQQETYRVVNSNQRTICIVVGVLTEEQIRMMTGGKMAMIVQMYLFPTEATHFNNTCTLEDGTVVHVMPGHINGWIRCKDDKVIGVCKEHVAHFSEWMSKMFFGQSFKDCGKDTVDVAWPFEVVLDALQIIYHRCHAVHFDRVDLVLELAGFWMSPVIIRYFDVAVWRTSHMLIEDKIELAQNHRLELTKDVLLHPEYHGIRISADLKAKLLKAD